MTASAPLNLVHKVWEYPLFEALFGRRSRRFGLGFETTEGPFKYKSRRPPLPLSDIEEAMLVAAGVGFSGLRSGIRTGRCHTAPAMAVPSPARRAAVARRCSSPTIKASTSLTPPPDRPANCEPSRRLMSETMCFRCTGKTARHCSSTDLIFLVVSPRSRGTTCNFRTCPVRRSSCRCAM